MPDVLHDIILLILFDIEIFGKWISKVGDSMVGEWKMLDKEFYDGR